MSLWSKIKLKLFGALTLNATIELLGKLKESRANSLMVTKEYIALYRRHAKLVDLINTLYKPIERSEEEEEALFTSMKSLRAAFAKMADEMKEGEKK